LTDYLNKFCCVGWTI